MKDANFIKKMWSEQTGGGIMIDFIELNNGQVIAISEDATGVYSSMKDFEDGSELSFAINNDGLQRQN